MNDRYVIGKDFNTKDWWVYDNEINLRVCWFNNEEQAKEWIEKKVEANNKEEN